MQIRDNITTLPISTEALDRRCWNDRYNHPKTRKIASQERLKVELRSVLIPMPFLYLAGVFSGIALTIAFAS